MSIKGPIRSKGICQRYEDFNRIDNLSYVARTTGLRRNELNFSLIKEGTLIGGSELQDGLDRTHGFNPQAGAYSIDPHGKIVPVPHLKQTQRDDLEFEVANRNRNRPRPY